MAMTELNGGFPISRAAASYLNGTRTSPVSTVPTVGASGAGNYGTPVRRGRPILRGPTPDMGAPIIAEKTIYSNTGGLTSGYSPTGSVGGM
jgi:hypothetical protein